MKAAYWYGKRDIRILNAEEPKPGSQDVKIRVKACGICGSDLQEYLAGPILIPTSPHPLTGAKAPLIIGHEFCGEIADVGREVRGWNVGDRVTADAKMYCMDCYFCRRGEYQLCTRMAYLGLASGNGAFAEYLCVPSHLLFKLADNMTYEEGALLEPTSIAVHAVKRSQIRAGDTATVVGAGPIGLLTLQVLAAAGARAIYAVEFDKNRINLARKLGADEVFNPKEVDVKKEINGLTNGIGTDFSFECVGAEESLHSCLEVVRNGGTTVVIGIFKKAVNLSATDLVYHEKNLIGSTDGDYPASIALVSKKKIDVNSLVTSKIKLENIVEGGFKQLENPKGHVKILVSPE